MPAAVRILPAGTNFHPSIIQRNFSNHSSAFSSSTVAMPRATLSIICSGFNSIGLSTCSIAHFTDIPSLNSTVTILSEIPLTVPISRRRVLRSTQTITVSPTDKEFFAISFKAYLSRKIFSPNSSKAFGFLFLIVSCSICASTRSWLLDNP